MVSRRLIACFFHLASACVCFNHLSRDALINSQEPALADRGGDLGVPATRCLHLSCMTVLYCTVLYCRYSEKLNLAWADMPIDFGQHLPGYLGNHVKDVNCMMLASLRPQYRLLSTLGISIFLVVTLHVAIFNNLPCSGNTTNVQCTFTALCVLQYYTRQMVLIIAAVCVSSQWLSLLLYLSGPFSVIQRINVVRESVLYILTVVLILSIRSVFHTRFKPSVVLYGFRGVSPSQKSHTILHSNENETNKYSRPSKQQHYRQAGNYE